MSWMQHGHGSIPSVTAGKNMTMGRSIYIAGSWGPASAGAMIGRDGYEWHDEL